MIEVSRLKDLNAAELFLGFRIGAVGRRDFAVFPVQGHGGLRRLKRYFGNKMSVGAQMVVVLKAFVEHCVSLVLGHPFECAWLDVSQTDVSHPFLLVSRDSLFPVAQESRSSSFCYQIVVRESENRQLLHLFSLVRGICGSLMRPNGGRKLGSRCPVLAFFARACPELAGGGSDGWLATDASQNVQALGRGRIRHTSLGRRWLDAVAASLGNSVKVRERHYAPRVKSRQDVLERAVKATWA